MFGNAPTAFDIPDALPAELNIAVPSGKRYAVKVLAVNKKGCELEYWPLGAGRPLPVGRPRVGSIPPEMVKLLDRKVSVQFDDATLPDIVDFLREVTPVQFVVFRQDLRADREVMTLHYNDGTVEHYNNS